MTRLATTFQRLRASGERALVTYFTAGDPSLEATARLAAEAERRGADVIELGVPFSDPLADGPVIQRAGQRALAAGASLVRVLETVKTLRAEVRAPIVLLTYYNPVLAFGLRPFAEAAAKAGVDGVIVADLPPEEAGPLGAEAEPVGLDVVHLAAPTSTTDRLRLIARRSRGFIYLVSLTGVTGERAALSRELEAQVRALRLVTTKPVCVGFGIGRPEQVAAVGRLADGVIVGSAIVRLVEERAGSPTLISDVGDFIASLKQPLRGRGPGAPVSTTLSTGRVAASSGHDGDARLPRPPEDTGLHRSTRAQPRPDASSAAKLGGAPTSERQPRVSRSRTSRSASE
jgi:tryptophan synthase alpha chain